MLGHEQRCNAETFSFDHWSNVNQFDGDLCRILKEQKLDSSSAILGLKDEEINELFDGLPRGYKISFRYARENLIKSIVNENDENNSAEPRLVASASARSISATSLTPPDPTVRPTTNLSIKPKPTVLPQKPKKPSRLSLSKNPGAIAVEESVEDDRKWGGSVPKDGGNVKKLAQQMQQHFDNKRKVSPMSDEVLFIDRCKVESVKSTPPPVPKRPNHKILERYLIEKESQDSISIASEISDGEAYTYDVTDDVDIIYSSKNLQENENAEEYYDVPPISPLINVINQESAESDKDDDGVVVILKQTKDSIVEFREKLENVLSVSSVTRSLSRLSVDMAPLYQHYEQQEHVTSNVSVIKRNKTFEPVDRRPTQFQKQEKLGQRKSLARPRPRTNTFWAELPEVKESNLLQTLAEDELKHQEAKFEIIKSQICFVKSLSIVATFFVHCPMLSGQTHLGSTINMQERKQLFSNIVELKEINEELLQELEDDLKENFMMINVVDIIIRHLQTHSKAYVHYCSNQTYQERMLTHLKKTNAEFRSVMSVLEGSEYCESLDLRSFLLSPMQRVTRYPLLCNAVQRNAVADGVEQARAERSLKLSNQLAVDCNETARKFERIEQLIELDKLLIYENSSPKRFALANSDRYLLKQNLVAEIQPVTNRNRAEIRSLFVFLMSDLLLITKPCNKNGKQHYTVLDYCQRPYVEMISIDESSDSNHGDNRIPSGYQIDYSRDNVILFILMCNSVGKLKRYWFNFETQTDKVRWLDAYRAPPSGEDDDSRIYDRNDCPQVQVIVDYRPKQDDELELRVNDVINVLQKLSDGWFQGERKWDGTVGWFPSVNVRHLMDTDHEKAKTIKGIRQKMGHSLQQ